MEIVERIPRDSSTQLSVITPMDMLNNAVMAGADISVLEKLMGLSERWAANQARMAFNDALAKASANFKPVVKNCTGHNNRKYADLSAIEAAVKTALNEQGLRYNFTSQQVNGQLAVTCVLSHRDGHLVENTLMAAPDNSGSKNSIQAVGSTSSYLMRYTLVQALGLSFVEDDDGAAAGLGAKVSPEQVETIRKALNFVQRTEAKFCEWKNVARLEDIPARDFENTLASIKGVKK